MMDSIVAWTAQCQGLPCSGNAKSSFKATPVNSRPSLAVAASDTVKVAKFLETRVIPVLKSAQAKCLHHRGAHLRQVRREWSLNPHLPAMKAVSAARLKEVMDRYGKTKSGNTK
jgi:hypothetical protein